MKKSYIIPHVESITLSTSSFLASSGVSLGDYYDPSGSAEQFSLDDESSSTIDWNDPLNFNH